MKDEWALIASPFGRSLVQSRISVTLLIEQYTAVRSTQS